MIARYNIWNINVFYQYTFNLLNQGHQLLTVITTYKSLRVRVQFLGNYKQKIEIDIFRA